MSRTALPAPLTDGRMWRKLLATVHPDSGGSDELFVWVTGIREAICERSHESGTHAHASGFRRPASSAASTRRSDARKTSAATEVDRVPFDPSVDFDELTSRALHLAESDEVGEPYADLLKLLAGCAPDGSSAGQHRGASYKQLACIGHLCGMDKLGRRELYRLGEQIPLSEIHANHLLDTLMKGAA